MFGHSLKHRVCRVTANLHPQFRMSSSPIRAPVLDNFVDFGGLKINRHQVFYESPSFLSLAIVNLKPVLPGHVLVIPRRRCKRFADMTAAEVQDLWCTVQLVGPKVERHFGGDSMTMCIQDGRNAGQTVEHVHVHVIPRRANDFEQNDEIYRAIEKERQPRTAAEMAAEADELRQLFVNTTEVFLKN